MQERQGENWSERESGKTNGKVHEGKQVRKSKCGDRSEKDRTKKRNVLKIFFISVVQLLGPFELQEKREPYLQ